MVPSWISTEEKEKNSLSTDKCMITAFRDCGGVVLVDAIPRGETINPDAYIRTLIRTQEAFQTSSASHESNIHLASTSADGRGKWSRKKLPGPKYFAYFFTFIRFAFAGRRGGAKKTSFTGDRTISWRLWLQHNAKQHAYLKTRKAIMKLSWTVLALPPYSRDLALSDSHLVQAVRSLRLTSMWFAQWELTTWAWQGIHAVVPRWHKAVEVDGCFVEKWIMNLNHYSSWCVIFII